MNQRSDQPPGFILVLTLMLLAMATLIVTRLYYKSAGARAYLHTSIERQQARLLAISGIELAKSKLDCDSFEIAQYLEKVFPELDVWQQINFTYAGDGVDGSLQLYISCELGKLNPNQFYDFKKRELKPAAKIALNKLFAKSSQFAGLVGILEKVLQQHTEPLNDLSELLVESEIAKLFNQQIYREPANSVNINHLVGHDNKHMASANSVDTNSGQKSEFYLTDLFTLYNPKPFLWSALLARDYLSLWHLDTLDTVAARRQSLQTLLQAIKEKQQLTNEKALGLLYGVDELVPIASEVVQLFEINLTPPIAFSILVDATVGLNTCRIFAIIQADSVQDAHMTYKLVRLYWI